MVKNTNPPAPSHLNPRAKSFWRRAVAQFEFTDSQLELLRRLTEAMARCDQAGDQLDQEGVTFRDKFGQLKQHPAAQVEAINRAHVLKLLQALKLDEADLETASKSASELARARWSR